MDNSQDESENDEQELDVSVSVASLCSATQYICSDDY